MSYPSQSSNTGDMYQSYPAPLRYQPQNQNTLPSIPFTIPLNMSYQPQQQQPYQQLPQQARHAQYNMPSGGNTASNTEPPYTPTEDGERADEAAHRALPDIPLVSKTYKERAYVLEVKQQPERARMCGFGDKDRRPISAPPCVRLRIYNVAYEEAREIDYSKIEDLSKYVILVDLVAEDGLHGTNIVSHAQSSPSISTVTTAAYPQTRMNTTTSNGSVRDYDLSNIPEYANNNNNTYGYPGSNGHAQTGHWGNGATGFNGGNGYNNDYGRQYPQHTYPRQFNYGGSSANTNGDYADEANRGSISGRGNSVNGTLSRNLIGNLTGSANRLEDLDGKTGIWFVFQDLSIRTEGWFRLKFQLFVIKDGNPESEQLSLSAFAPLVAESYSRPFKVYSAKKFPGVVDTTALSKKFADQGIKIPIRKELAKESQKDDGSQKPGDKRKRSGPAVDSDGEGDDMYE